MPVISVEHLSKTYRLGQIGTPSESTRGELPAPSRATWKSGGRNFAASTMIFHKSLPSMLSLLALAMIALMSFSPARPAWLINAWSLQYAHHTFLPAAEQSVIANPPAGHARAKFWLAQAALQSGDPALAETLIASQAAQGDPLSMRLMSDALAALAVGRQQKAV